MKTYHNKAASPYENRMFLETIEPGCREVSESLGIVHSCLINSAKVKIDEGLPVDVDALFFTQDQMVIVEMKNYQKVNMLDQEGFLNEPWKVVKGEASNDGNTYRSDHNKNPYQQTNNIKDKIINAIEGINGLDVQRIVVVPNDCKIIGEIPSNIYDFSIVNERDFKKAFFQHINVVSHGTAIDADDLLKRSVEDRTPRITSRPTTKLKEILRRELASKIAELNKDKVNGILNVMLENPKLDNSASITALYKAIYPNGVKPKSQKARRKVREAVISIASRHEKDIKKAKTEITLER
jgi:hypothetical protein